MKKNLLIFIFFIVIANPLYSQNKIKCVTINSGGSIINAPNHTIHGTVGQLITGAVSSITNQHEIEAGFWYCSFKLKSPIVISKDSKISITTFKLFQNIPNPFNSSTKISFRVPLTSHIILRIFDSTGRTVKTLINEKRQKGEYTLNWDGRNDSGSKVTSGLYFYQLKCDVFTITKSMILMK